MNTTLTSFYNSLVAGFLVIGVIFVALAIIADLNKIER